MTDDGKPSNYKLLRKDLTMSTNSNNNIKDVKKELAQIEKQANISLAKYGIAKVKHIRLNLMNDHKKNRNSCYTINCIPITSHSMYTIIHNLAADYPFVIQANGLVAGWCSTKVSMSNYFTHNFTSLEEVNKWLDVIEDDFQDFLEKLSN